MPHGICSSNDCTNATVGRGLCRKHYLRWWKVNGGDLAPQRPKQCQARGCSAANKSRGYCDMHYSRWKRHGDPLYVRPVRVCSVACCESQAQYRGWCRRHYEAWRATGDPCTPRRPKSVAGQVCTHPSCDRAVDSRGLCVTHYQAWWRETTTGDRSLRARDGLRRALRRAVPAEAIDPHAVFVRDGWRCGVCSDPIDPLLRHPDPQCATVDHVVPLSRGGHHTYANVQASHLVCNLRKGAKMPGQSVA